MRSWRRCLQLLIPAFLCCTAWAQAQSPLKTINNPGGGQIVYGLVAGAKTNAAAMARVLVSVQKICGERPQIGQPFRLRGSDSLALFFTVVNHPQGNLPVAGMLIAATSGPNHVETGMVSDYSARFGTTVNPMLKKLFEVWHPGGDAPPAGRRAGGGRIAPPARLHMAAAPDNSAYVAIPDGWKVLGGGGTVTVLAPSANYAVTINLNMVRGATNPSPYQRYPGQPGMGNPIVYPSNADPVRAFPDIIRQLYWLSGNTINLRVDRVEPAQFGPGYRCLHGVGGALLGQHPPEVPLWEMEAILCTTAPGPGGRYTVSLSLAEMDPRFADQWRTTVGAIFQSFQVNEAVVDRQAAAIAAPVIANIHAIGQNAMARAAESDRENDRQHADWRNQQDDQAKRVWGFSSGYLLDQSVVRDNETGGQTNWIGNNFANQLIQSDPNRFETVQNQDLLMGWNAH